MGQVKILIIENHEEYFEQTKLILDEINKKSENKYSYFPLGKTDFFQIRSSFSTLFSPNEKISNSSAQFLNEVVRDADLLLLEYNLSGNDHVDVLSDIDNTAIDFYQLLNLDKKALIYTRATSINIENIKKQIVTAGLSDRVDVISKPLQPHLQYVTPEKITFLRENIEAILKR